MTLNPPSARVTWAFFWLVVLPVWLYTLHAIFRFLMEYLA